jgi:hypothetical protein
VKSHQARRQRRRPRSCPGREEIGRPLPDDLYQHVCGLQEGHFGPHLCWCGFAFGIGALRWIQPPLPLYGLGEVTRER